MPRSTTPPSAGFKFGSVPASLPMKSVRRITARENVTTPASESSTSWNVFEAKGMEKTSRRSAKDTKDAVDGKVLVHELFKSGRMVKVYTGKEKHCWDLHEDAICHYSSYFRKAFQSGFKESTEKSIELVEEDSEVFGCVVDWIYTGVLQCKKCIQDPKNHQEEDFMQYIHLWIFADKYMVAGLSQRAVEQWSRCHGKASQTQPHVKEIEYIIENCPEKSPLRDRVVTDALKHFLNKENQDYKSMARILTCDGSFAEEFTKQLKEHLAVVTWECRIRNCSPHDTGSFLISDRAAKRQRVDLISSQGSFEEYDALLHEFSDA